MRGVWRWFRMVRIAEWGVQLVIVAVVAAIYILGTSIDLVSMARRTAVVTIWTALLLAGGYLFNTFTDRREDALAGHHHRIAPAHPTLVLVHAFAFLMAGLFALWQFESLPVVRVLGIAQVAALFAYSLPHPRLKERGWWGLATAAVFQRVPSFFALLVAFPIEPVRASALVVWLIALGFLFIMEHQIEDLAGDSRAQVRTWAVEVGMERARSATRRVYYSFGLASAVCVGILFATGDGLGAVASALAMLTFALVAVALFRARYRTAGPSTSRSVQRSN